jgi:hypothetical protein
VRAAGFKPVLVFSTTGSQMAKGNGNAKPIIEFNTETLRGDIRDKVLAEFKLMPKSW